MAALATVWRALGWRGLALIAALGVVAWLAIGKAVLRADLAKAHAATAAEIAAHRETKNDYRMAQLQAAKIQAERIAAVQAKQEEISNEVGKSYEIRLADLRDRSERLRRQLAGTQPAGAAGSAAVPGPVYASGGLDGAPASALPPGGNLTLDDLEWRALAERQAIQLDELITLIERQAAEGTILSNGPVRSSAGRPSD